MPDLVTLLPGWGFGPEVMRPLQQALQQRLPDTGIAVQSLPELPDAEDWLDWLDRRIPAGSWLIGWSLGGTLATVLAARRGQDTAGLVTVACNPCFVQRADWPHAMEKTVFSAFCQGCHDEPHATRLRFSLLCAQGERSPRHLSRSLQMMMPAAASEVMTAGLQWLQQDVRPALTQFSGPILSLFAAHDALVPVTAAAEVARLSGASIEIHSTGHALLFSAADTVARSISRFIKAHPHAQ